MRMDTVIMGGGLSGLTCGIALAKRGQRVTIVASGQSTLLFNGGSMDLLGYIDGKAVTNPIEAISLLPDSHPYRKIGADRFADLANEAKQLIDDSGITMLGNANANHWRITPMGIAKPAWLTQDKCMRIDSLDELPFKRLALMCVRGFFDIPNSMLASGLREIGFEVDLKEFTTDDITALRRSPSEMRATSLAKHLVSNNALQRVADQINTLAGDADMVLLPCMLVDEDAADTLQSMLHKPLRLVATLPPSVPGMRMQKLLQHYFRMLGGSYLMGDSVTGAAFDGNRLTSVTTAKLGDMSLKADNFVLATGSFISRGLVADYEHVYEPIMGLDVDSDADPEHWTRFGVLEPQDYMRYGVATDNDLHGMINGQPVTNLRVIGSILSGHDAVKMGDGTGVSLMTALAVNDLIIAKK